jgi:hypothetical protein
VWEWKTSRCREQGRQYDHKRTYITIKRLFSDTPAEQMRGTQNMRHESAYMYSLLAV